jgi:POT family proton-dependent oligopeptide transporter
MAEQRTAGARPAYSPETTVENRPPPAPAATVDASVLDDRSLFGHPRGLGLLFVVEMWERFSYYGMRALLVLYLMHALSWDKAHAAGLYGTYTSLVYLTPLVGGYLADRLLGTRHALVLGGLVIAAGHFCLAFPGLPMFYTGLGLIIAGTGLFKPNASTMVGQLYRPGDPRRDAGFTIFYMGVNAGAFIGPILCGALAQSERFGWHYGFALAGVGMVAGVITYLVFRDKWLPGVGLAPARSAAAAAPDAAEPARAQGRRVALDAAGGALAGGLLAWLLGGWSVMGIAFGVMVGAVLAATVLGTAGEERKRVIALFLVAFFVIFFWAAYEQAGSSMNVFADVYTDLRIGRRSVPSTWFQSVNPLMILIFAPVFAGLWNLLAARGREPSTVVKMVFGFVLLGVGFVFMAAGGARADAGRLVSPFWLVAAYGFHTLGELCLSPVGLSYVSKIAPARFGALLMGAWFLANAAANKLAGALAGFMPTPGEAHREAGSGLAGLIARASQTNFGFYAMFVVSSFAAAALMLLFVPLLKRLTASVKT